MDVEKDQLHMPPPPMIPIIDLNDPDQELVSRALVKASEEWGFFHLVNHGISADLIDRLKQVGKQFFDLSDTEKKAVAKPDDSEDYEGYTTNLEYTEVGLWAENLFHRIGPPSRLNFSYWPKNPPQYRKVVEEYTEGIKKVSEKILRILSVGLGLRHDALKEGFGGETLEYSMRVNNYPPNPRSELSLGLLAHTDLIGLAYIVSNEVPGLQILHDDHWFDVEYIPSGITVTIGDQLMRMSNGKYKNVMHRVTLNNEKHRMSWPVFVDSPPDAILGPLPELITDDNPSKFKPIICKDFKFRKLNMLPVD